MSMKIASKWEERLGDILSYLDKTPIFTKDTIPLLTECMVLTVKLDRYFEVDNRRSDNVCCIVIDGYSYSRRLTKQEFKRCYNHLETNELLNKLMVPCRLLGSPDENPTAEHFLRAKEMAVEVLEKMADSRCVWSCESRRESVSHCQKEKRAMETAESFLLNEGFALSLLARDWFDQQKDLVRWSNAELQSQKLDPFRVLENRVLVQSAMWCNDVLNRISPIENCFDLQDRFLTQPYTLP